ncbi:cell-death-related nuclease 7 [Aphis gossypii]|uniref:cell-death-related nuclease 7 n=1 Tax=Aphis gossypii TaxID=80765 RepID=UPI002159429A|nr:cell-death-related nuclease 7 [Aphis gossypii]XP_050054149.1 cell-death-related nuclease 7 [Aphis gossypii]
MSSHKMERAFSTFVVVSMTVIIVMASGDRLQCKDPNGQSVDWFTAIKLPKLKSSLSNGTIYIYMDAKNPEWTYSTGIVTKEKSAIGHTVSQMYTTNQAYNESIMWIVYNDEPTNGPATFTKGHSKGTVVADKSSGFWLVHSVPKFPQLPYQNNNSYTYPKTGIKYGQSFLCMSMTAEELDKVGNQLINNEVMVYGSHFGGDLKSTYPDLYNATLPHKIVKNGGVRLQPLRSIEGFEFLSISKNRHFGKDLYDGYITQMAQSNVYTETWLNSRDRLNSSCSGHYKTMNIKSLITKDIKGLENVSYKSALDHSKWVVTGKSSVPWTCIGDINRAKEQMKRGGGTVCIKSMPIWNQYKQLVSSIEKCKA